MFRCVLRSLCGICDLPDLATSAGHRTDPTNLVVPFIGTYRNRLVTGDIWYLGEHSSFEANHRHDTWRILRNFYYAGACRDSPQLNVESPTKKGRLIGSPFHLNSFTIVSSDTLFGSTNIVPLDK